MARCIQYSDSTISRIERRKVMKTQRHDFEQCSLTGLSAVAAFIASSRLLVITTRVGALPKPGPLPLASDERGREPIAKAQVDF